MAKNKPFLLFLQHFLIGMILTMKGIDTIILAFGLIVLAFFFYSLFVKRPSHKLTLVAHLFEAIAALFTAYIFFTEGATYLPYLFLLAAIGFFIGVYVHLKKGHTH